MSWRDVYFGRQSAITRLGLVQAPMRDQPSHELLAGRELEARQREQEARIEREMAEATRRKFAPPVVDKVEELRAMVREFGAETVTRISRRLDPTFELPPELAGEDPEKE